MITIAKTVRTFIRVSGIILTAIFVWLQVKGLPFGTYIGTIEPDSLRRITLATYYACWYFGSQFDVNLQERVLFAEEGKIKLDWRGIGLLVLCVALAGVLFWSANDDVLLALVLTIFLGLNIAGFKFILNFLDSPFSTARQRYSRERHYSSLVQLEIVSLYMYGKWQRTRFCAGVAIVIALNLICLNSPLREYAAAVLERLLPVHNAQQILPSVILFIFVAVMEIWIWFKRAVTRLLLNLVENMQPRYGLTLVRADRSKA